MTLSIRSLRKAILLSLEHDVLNSAKAAAYSGMLALFPALVVLTALLAQVPEGTSLVGEVRGAFEQFLPDDSMSLLRSTMEARKLYSVQLIFFAAVFSVFAGLGMMLSLMEGFRRAYELPLGDWGFWRRRRRALAAGAHRAGSAVAGHPGAGLRPSVRVVDDRQLRPRAAALRAVFLAHGALGHRDAHQHQRPGRSLSLRHKTQGALGPGGLWSAVAATLVWFPSTLVFGWYVTRIADYSMFYGPFGAGIATLVWLYITSFSALLGAELNGVLFRERQEQASAGSERDCSGL
jgi:membrane protein